MRTIVHLTALAILSLSTPVAAEPDTADIAANALFDEARHHLEAGRIAEACTSFHASYKISSSPATLFNLARCREKNEQPVAAYGLYREVERVTRDGSDARQKRLHRNAGERADQLGTSLSKLTIRVSETPGLHITRNRIELDPAMWNAAVPVDGGTYKIVASAPGYRDWSTEITIERANDRKTLDVPALAPLALVVAPAPVVEQPVVRKVVAPTIAPPVRTAEPRSKLTPVLVSTSAALLLGGALAVELKARGARDASTHETDAAKQLALSERAKDKRVMATSMAVTGVGAAGVAVWLVLRKHAETPPSARIGKSVVAPSVSTQHVGLQLTRSY